VRVRYSRLGARRLPKMEVRVKLIFPLTLCTLPVPAMVSAGPVVLRLGNSIEH